MRTTWRVQQVTMTEGLTVADLIAVEWFKKNPAHTQMMEEYDALVEAVGQEAADEQVATEPDEEWIEEFLDAEPGEPTAEFIEATGRMSIDITGGLDLRPGDNVIVNVDAVERVSADA